MSDSKTLKHCNIMVVDDHRNIRVSLKLTLESEGATVTEAGSKTEALKLLASPEGSITNTCPYDLFLFDVRLGDGSGMDLLRYLAEAGLGSRVIMISGEGTAQDAYQATKIGAFDYIEKPFTPERIIVTSQRCLDFNKLRRRAFQADEIIGSHPSIIEVNRLIARIAKTHTRVLVHGDTGTGKELVAKSIHRQSSRSSKPLIKVNCAAIPHTLIESELFGHEKGSFTGAVKQRRGLFEQADGGTLFLDEIGELSLDVQAKLLRVLETGDIVRLGSEKSISVDVRVLAATHRGLEDMVRSGEFREDLFYRLNVVTVEIPSLKERGRDILEIARHFLEIACEEHSLGVKTLSDVAEQQLLSHHWPGNIRELKNTIERCAILSELEVIEQIQGLSNTQPPQQTRVQDESDTASGNGDFSFRTNVQSWEAFHNQIDHAYVSFILKECRGNVSEAARTLCLERAYLHRLMKKLGIQRDVSIS